jgi:hypothetical protein
MATFTTTAYSVGPGGRARKAGEATVLAEALTPYYYTPQKRMFGVALVHVQLPKPGSHINGFTAISLEEHVQEGGKWLWKPAGTCWDLGHIHKHVGDVCQVYDSPGYEDGLHLYKTKLLPKWGSTGLPIGYNSNDPENSNLLYLELGWPPVEGRSYRSTVILCNVNDMPMDTDAGPSREFPKDFWPIGPTP